MLVINPGAESENCPFQATFPGSRRICYRLDQGLPVAKPQLIRTWGTNMGTYIITHIYSCNPVSISLYTMFVLNACMAGHNMGH